MLAIRMQRTGRKGHAMFRVVVQDARRTPTSGKVVARLGSYDPHSKTLNLDKDKAAFYLEHGAQPSDRIAGLLKSEGVKLPAWVKLPTDKQRDVRNPEKRRSTRPAEAAAPAEPVSDQDQAVESNTDQDQAAEPAAEASQTAEPAETDASSPTEDQPAEAAADDSSETAKSAESE